MEEFQTWGFLRLVLLIWVLIHHAAAQVLISSGTEWTALIHLRGSLGIRSVDWPIKADPCTNWKGVQCSDKGRVAVINISGFKRTRTGRLNPGFNIDSIANFSALEVFNASRFPLPGSIPDWFGSSLSSSLRVLDLRSTSVSGPIPASIGELSHLNQLYLSGNELAGSLPAELGKLERISVVDLSRNLLTGSIPPGFGSRSNLSRLDLSSNYLSGSIPGGLFANDSKLQFLDLSDNSFSGSIPNKFGNLSKLGYLNLSKNSLSGSLPSVWSALPSLQRVDVSANSFTGDIEKLSFNGTAAVLNLSNNMLYGTLATSQFGNLSLVDVSGNYIQGKVPPNTPANVILNSNCLEVVLNQRTLESCRSFYAPRELAFHEFGPPLPLPASESGQKKSKTWIYILVGVGGGIIFIVVLALILVLFLSKFDRNSSSPRESPNVIPVPEESVSSKDQTNISGLGNSFTYEHLRSFISENNLIKHGHSGDLFKGFLEGGVPIVVKRVDLGSTKELEFLSKYSHTRLLPLLGHCLENENDKFLVYKYMPNGDLATSLHKVVSSVEGDGLQSLDWITRLKIATGAAEVLCYLHHDCTPPVVHRDVQASSILLDDKFEVRLGSLSEIRVQEGESHHNKIITRFLRKSSQLSSESNSSGGLTATTTTCSYDVYCFGKVLLELITGKVGVSKLEDAQTREWVDDMLGYISIYDKELVSKIVDSSMMVDEDLLEEVWAMAIIARSCLNPKPSKRPPMKYILRALENPLKVVRDESYYSSTTSSSFFGSWRHSSSENANRSNRDTSKQPGRVGSYGSGGIEFPSSNKRLSSEIFPEPLDIQDIERHDPSYH
ncbi:Probable LRR receptor-like serine/threonine-protein kinase At2g16250 [Linum grandiflorum]